MGALTDNLVPDTVVEEAEVQELENELYDGQQAIYIPPELVNDGLIEHSMLYHCYYLIELKAEFVPNELVHLCRMFQVAVFGALRDHSFDKLKKSLDEILSDASMKVEYLILPPSGSSCNSSDIDWRCVRSIPFQGHDGSHCDDICPLPKGSAQVHTKNGLICRCMLKNCLVYTPHNGSMYCILGSLDHLNVNSYLSLKYGGAAVTYKQHFKRQ